MAFQSICRRLDDGEMQGIALPCLSFLSLRSTRRLHNLYSKQIKVEDAPWRTASKKLIPKNVMMLACRFVNSSFDDKTTRESMKSVSLLVFCALFLLGSLLMAQDNAPDAPEPYYGGFFHLNINMHRAGFTRLPNVPNCCREFTGGSGVGFTVGALYDFPLSSSLFLDFRAGYSLLGADLIEPEETTVIVSGQPTTGEFEHQLEANLGAVIVEPALGYRITPRFTVRAGAGLAALLSATYNQREELVRPEETGVFENNKRTRNEFEGDIPNASSLLAYAKIGLGYDFPLNKQGTLIGTPEIVYTRGFSSVVSDSSWSVDALRVGLSVTFRSKSDEPDYPVLVATDIPLTPDTTQPLPVRQPPVASVRAVGLDDDGNEVPTATLRVEEFISTHMRPLLNYLFFDEQVDTIPERYNNLDPSETKTFRVENLHGVGTIATYHHLLNIVGRRMIEYPEAKITIVGCNDGLGEKKEGGRALSQRRADNVFQYLSKTWGIDSSRMQIELRGLPAKPSNMEVVDGVQENRRVEIYSDTWDILAPVITDDTLRITNPPAIRFKMEASGPAPITGWQLVAGQELGGSSTNAPLKELRGDEALPETVDWNLEEEQQTIPRFDAPLQYRLQVTDSLGQVAETELATLPVEQITVSKKRRERIADKYIDRYSLILFDFDRAEFNAANERIGEFIRERLREGATVTITGYTDRIGEEDYNLNLSKRRAGKTAENLATADADVSGVGETVELYNNNLPEGRFYSRTVTIVVETPVDENVE